MKNLLIIGMLIAWLPACSQSTSKKSNQMKVAVWDTYVKRSDGRTMHFDIIVPETMKDTAVIYGYGREYLTSKMEANSPLTSKECRFCHIESVKPQWEQVILKYGYYIYEMENCD